MCAEPYGPTALLKARRELQVMGCTRKFIAFAVTLPADVLEALMSPEDMEGSCRTVFGATLLFRFNSR